MAAALRLVRHTEENASPDLAAHPRAKFISRTGQEREQPISREDAELAALATSLLTGSLDAAGLRQADLAAIMNCSEGRVRAKLDPTNDGAPITLRDVLRLRQRAPSAWRAIVSAMSALDWEGTK